MVIEAFHLNGICVFAAQISGRIELAPIQYDEVAWSPSLAAHRIFLFALRMAKEPGQTVECSPQGDPMGGCGWGKIESTIPVEPMHLRRPNGRISIRKKILYARSV